MRMRVLASLRFALLLGASLLCASLLFAQALREMRMLPAEMRGGAVDGNQLGSSGLAGVHTRVLFGDVDPTEARIMAAVQKPLSVNSFTAKSGPPAWKTLPSWYMVATDDQMIPPQAEEFMAKRMGAEIRKVASSHAAMVSHPKEVADLISLAANSVTSA